MKVLLPTIQTKTRFAISVLLPLGLGVIVGQAKYPVTSPHIYEWETERLVTWLPLSSAWWYWAAMALVACLWAIVMRPPTFEARAAGVNLKWTGLRGFPHFWLAVGLASAAALSEAIDLEVRVRSTNGFLFLAAASIFVTGLVGRGAKANEENPTR